MWREELPAPLFRLKTLIWVQSVVASALIAGFTWAVFWKGDADLVVGFLVCFIAWFAGVVATMQRAAAMSCEERTGVRGFPPLILGLVAMGQVFNFMMLGYTPFAMLILPADLLLGLTLLIRWMISSAMDVPVHRELWGLLGGVLGLGAAGFGFILYLAYAGASC